jgi:hypothetical protein
MCKRRGHPRASCFHLGSNNSSISQQTIDRIERNITRLSAMGGSTSKILSGRGNARAALGEPSRDVVRV